MFARQDKDIPQSGDVIVLFAGKGRINRITLEAGETFCHRFGAFRHDDIIGKPYGSKIQATTKKGEPGRGFCHVLRPNYPDLWCLGPLDHHTQIIYPMDISQICFHLELCPGKRVVESGTGSGSLSLGFARCIYPTGRLDTFEFNEERVEATKKHFKEVGLDTVIHSHWRDVLTNGFDVPDGSADAVFLDLPAPWRVVEDSHRCLNDEGNFCSFSPCIEQIQRTCDRLREVGFEDIRVVEALLRTMDVVPRDNEPLNLEKRRLQDKSLKYGEKQQENKSSESNGVSQDTKSAPMDEDMTKGKTNNPSLLGKRSEPDVPTEEDGTDTPVIKPEEQTAKYSSKMRRFEEIPVPNGGIDCRPTTEIKGHTSYLLFARKIPGSVFSQANKDGEAKVEPVDT